MPSQTPATAASEVPSFTPDTHAPLSLADAEQASPSQAPAVQMSPAVAETLSAPPAPSQNVIQVAATSSTQPEQNAPADQKAAPRSATQPRSALDQETLHASCVSVPGTSVPGTFASSSALKATRFGPALEATPPAASAAKLPAPAHGALSSATEAPAATNSQTISTADNSSNNAAPHQPGNASDSSSTAQSSATGAASPSASSSSPASPPASSKKDSGGDPYDSEQPKNSPNVVATTAADSLPTAASPTFNIAAPSAQVSVGQPSSMPDAGAKANSQTSASVPDNAQRSSLPATADTPSTATASPLQWAQMANKAGQAEMRIGLTTAEFGSVEVRTTVHASDVGVLIGSEKGDLRSLLTPELPGIASTLQQQDLRLAQVSFHQQGFAFAGNSSFSQGNSQPRSLASRPQPALGSSEESSAPDPVRVSEPVLRQSGAGLSILA